MGRPWSKRRRTCSASSRTACSAISPTSGRSGRTRAQGGKFLVLPPGFKGSVPEGYFVSRSPTYSVTFAVRGFQVDGKTDQAVALMKQIKVYPLAKASSPPPMEFLNGSGQDIDTLFPGQLPLLRTAGDARRRGAGGELRSAGTLQMQAIGIEKGKPFSPDDKTKALLGSGAARRGHRTRQHLRRAGARVFYYPDRKWQHIPDGMTYTFTRDGAPQIDARNNVYYMAAGNSPGDDGRRTSARARSTCGPIATPTATFSTARRPTGCTSSPAFRQQLLVRRRLRRAQPLGAAERPAAALVSSYAKPVDQRRRLGRHRLRPGRAEGEGNWIRTVPGRGWFPIFRFYGPAEPSSTRPGSWKTLSRLNNEPCRLWRCWGSMDR